MPENDPVTKTRCVHGRTRPCDLCSEAESTSRAEDVDRKFRAAWDVFAQTCRNTVAPEATYQAWFAHYVISQFGIDRVAREPDFGHRRFTSAFSDRFSGHTVKLDLVVTRLPGVFLPHRSWLDDTSGASRLPHLAVISELKVASTQGGGLDHSLIRQDFWKLAMLLEEADRLNEETGAPIPLAYVCVLDNHDTHRYRFDYLKSRLEDDAVGDRVQLLRGTIDGGVSG